MTVQYVTTDNDVIYTVSGAEYVPQTGSTALIPTNASPIRALITHIHANHCTDPVAVNATINKSSDDLS